MKKMVFLFLLVIAFSAQGGKFGIWLKHYAKNNAPSMICAFGSGLWSGQMDALQFHYAGVKRILPFIDDQWANPGISWTNKYKNGDPTQGERFPGSTTIFVSTTDQWHFAQMQMDALIVCAVVFHPGVKQKWYMYIVDLAVYMVAYTTGKNLSYELLNIK